MYLLQRNAERDAAEQNAACRMPTPTSRPAVPDATQSFSDIQWTPHESGSKLLEATHEGGSVPTAKPGKLGACLFRLSSGQWRAS